MADTEEAQATVAAPSSAQETNGTDSRDNQPAAQAMTSKSSEKCRYDWYQTDTHVVVNIMVKNIKSENVQVDYSERALSVTVKLPSGNDYSLELDLPHTINVEQCRTKVLSTKIELKMKKVEGIRWAKLEDDGQTTSVKHFTPDDSSASAHRYPSSSHTHHDWDKLAAQVAKEEKDEKLEGDAALNKLFQQIYGDGSDETRRAMNKSFQESGGTVLSTNWEDIKKGKVDVKPPDGMEYKKWEM